MKRAWRSLAAVLAAAVVPMAAVAQEGNGNATPQPSSASPASAGEASKDSGSPLNAGAPGAPTGSAASPLAPFAWLAGCWQGAVNGREFREVWLPLRGSVMVGVSQTVGQGRTLDYEYLRLEPRSNVVYYVAQVPGKPETAFRLEEQTTDNEAAVFRFENPGSEFPRRITYRRATLGWLYAEVEGTAKGAPQKVIYPMRRIDCATDAFVEQ